jgi:hypothetical protein
VERTLVVLVALAALVVRPAAAAPKKLVEFGWDEPDTAFMLVHASAMEEAPFDGTVFHITYARPDGSRGPFTNEAWGRRAFTAAELGRAEDELVRTRFRRFTENFLRFNIQPGDVDWFDDFDAVTHNARQAGRIARAGRARGILFDVEQYDRPVFEYRRLRDAAHRSWDEYAAQARRRGREVMAAFQDGFGDRLVVLLTFGISLPYGEARGDVGKLPDARYGLLKPFIEGMIDGTRRDAKLIDGYELSYGFRAAREFADAARTVRSDVARAVSDPSRYRDTVSVAFGLWLDYAWTRNGWDVANPAANYFTPDGIERALRAAFDAADDYVWLYSETPRWWSPTGRVKLPDAYVAAIERARTAAGDAP